MIKTFILNNQFFCLPLLVGVCIQFLKLCIDWIQTRKPITRNGLRTAGGFPSVHSGISASLVTILWLVYGISSPFFAISLCFWILFRYDAANVRFQAGQHAQYLNYLYRLLHQLEKLGIHEKHLDHLKERLWHTVIEVVGWVISWIILTLLLVYLL